MSGSFLIFLMNACEANKCVAPESISTYAGVLEIDSSPDITEGFPSASGLYSSKKITLGGDRGLSKLVSEAAYIRGSQVLGIIPRTLKPLGYLSDSPTEEKLVVSDIWYDDMALTADVALTDDISTFNWMNDVALTAYVALTNDMA
ncbi:hypothetical protein WN944_014937 [Citrus x changshan-huyou]|uniref:Uncharacterized protein n=1 Tax=Citrus x changshan-huyou TaxID=2935761 RepID=A0AAP0QM15_9ROSI